MKVITVLLLALFFSHAAKASEPRCSHEATEQANKLLTFHMGAAFDGRMSFESPRQKPSIKNPRDAKQKFNVLEVTANVSPHGLYRMRFIYFAPLGSDCTLMGQEILEFARL
ncbi:hypothetical protein [Rhodanobacter soli]|jgi:hypothetical protein|uniref:Uncharacterized protein n=1 Tax=Rhodanobacter soli TaxID=590609 RepID=A0ABV2PWP7_9GAMM